MSPVPSRCAGRTSRTTSSTTAATAGRRMSSASPRFPKSSSPSNATARSGRSSYASRARSPSSTIMSATTTSPMSTDGTANAVLEIDLGALVGNWRSLRDRLPPSAICAGIVKADAYGLGMAAVAPALEAAGCTLFFVAQLAEAVALRQLLPRAEIAVLNGPLPTTEADFVAHRLIPLLNDLGQIPAWPGVR